MSETVNSAHINTHSTHSVQENLYIILSGFLESNRHLENQLEVIWALRVISSINSVATDSVGLGSHFAPGHPLQFVEEVNASGWGLVSLSWFGLLTLPLSGRIS